MTEPQIVTEHQVENLDLLAFLKVLGKGAWLIALCTVLFGGLAFAATYLMKTQWKAEAYLDQPTTADLGNYYALSSMYQLMSGEFGGGEVGEPDKVRPDSDRAIIDDAYREVKRELASYNTVRQFWLNTDYYKQQLTDDPKKDADLLEKLIRSMVFTQGNPVKKQPDRITLLLDNPKLAQELLTFFINFSNLTAREVLYSDLVVKWQTLFDQTSAAVQAQLGKTRVGQNIEEQDWPGKLKMIQSVKPLDNQFVGYRYIKAPALLSKTYPERFLWAGMAAVFGFLFGCALVLSLNLRRADKRNHSR